VQIRYHAPAADRQQCIVCTSYSFRDVTAVTVAKGKQPGFNAGVLPSEDVRLYLSVDHLDAGIGAGWYSLHCTASTRSANRRFRNPERSDWKRGQSSANCPRTLKVEVSAAGGRKVETLESWRPIRQTAPLDTKRWFDTTQVLCRPLRESVGRTPTLFPPALWRSLHLLNTPIAGTRYLCDNFVNTISI
jgi:hypothetical protein